jgi:regulator of cell morphogenesis and NO signaling
MSEGRGDDSLLGCTISGLATRDPRAASILVQHGLDLCEDGLETLAEACADRGVDPAALCDDLATLHLPDAELRGLSSPWWALDELCAILVERHHGYFRRVLPTIRQQLHETSPARGGADLAAMFERLADALTLHLVKEEHLVFPAFTALAEARRAGVVRPPGTAPHLLGPIRAMEEHHREIEALVAALEAATSGFRAGDADPPAWRTCCRDLAQFVHELRTHVQLENGLLFPRALELESEFP